MTLLRVWRLLDWYDRGRFLSDFILCAFTPWRWRRLWWDWQGTAEILSDPVLTAEIDQAFAEYEEYRARLPK